MTEHKSHIVLAVVAVIIAALMNSILAALIKIAQEHDQATSAIIFWRSFLALFVLVPLITLRPPKIPLREKLKPNRFDLILIRCFAAFFGIYLFYYCVHKLSLAIAILLFFTSTLFMPLVAYAWKRTKITSWTWAGLAVGFAGVLLVIKPGHALFNVVSLLGLLSGFFTSIGQFAVHVASSQETSERINFYYFVIIGLLGLIITLFDPVRNWENLSWAMIGIFFAIGLLTLFYLFFINYALKNGPPPLISGFLYSSVIFASIIDWFFWKITIDMLTLMGMILIVIGVLLKYYHLQQQQKKS